MLLGLIPTSTLWEFRLPFVIRGAATTSTLAKDMLDLVLQSIEQCNTLRELTDHLNRHTVTLLNDYIKRLREAARALDERDIIRNYGAVLESLEAEGNALLQPMSRLPHPKEQIRAALINAIETTTDENIKEALQVALFCLDDFVPDAEVPVDPIENALAWARRREGRSKS